MAIKEDGKRQDEIHQEGKKDLLTVFSINFLQLATVSQ